MSDDRPAIFALDAALKRHGISRDEVTMLNRIKLDLLIPEDECKEASPESSEPFLGGPMTLESSSEKTGR